MVGKGMGAIMLDSGDINCLLLIDVDRVVSVAGDCVRVELIYIRSHHLIVIVTKIRYIICL